MRIFLALLLSFTAHAGPPELPTSQSGDVILLPLRCMLCTAISEETNSIYSHSGVLIQSPQGEWKVAEALDGVRLVSVSSFLKRTARGQRPGVFRPKELQERPELAQNLWQIFADDFSGAQFDPLFLWDNRDEQGRELYYCSEFVAKFLNRVLENPIVPWPMSFTRNWDFWERYFANYGGQVPQGLLGLAPMDLERREALLPLEMP